MSLITFNGLVDLVDQGVITGVARGHINAASIDVTLADSFFLEDMTGFKAVDLISKETPSLLRVRPNNDGKVKLGPGDFCLASTQEKFFLPNDIAIEFKLKSSLARSGLNHLLAGWGDPGWNDSALTLELHNVLQWHTLLLTPGMKIGQVVFWQGEPVPGHASYASRGRYNGTAETTPSRGVE